MAFEVGVGPGGTSVLHRHSKKVLGFVPPSVTAPSGPAGAPRDPEGRGFCLFLQELGKSRHLEPRGSGVQTSTEGCN